MHTGSSKSNLNASIARPFDPSNASRPDPSLMTYYIIVSLCTVFGFPFVIWPLLFKYRTLRYAFDDKGVSMSYGLLFRKEVYLTYRRIQDIQVSRNIFHRWLGLAAVAVQTASGSSSAEMTIEGITDPEGLRDFLYSKMRGARDALDSHAVPNRNDDPPHAPSSSDQPDQILELLHEIRHELRSWRDQRSPGP